MPLLPALRAFFTRLLTDVDDALFPQHVFCLTCGALSLPNAICPACLAVLDDLRLPSDALAPNAAAVWSYHGIARQLVLMLNTAASPNARRYWRTAWHPRVHLPCRQTRLSPPSR